MWCSKHILYCKHMGFACFVPVHRPDNVSAAMIPAAAPAESPDDDARLSTLVLTGSNSTVFDLSPSFQADVTQYGAMVGATCKEVTLCFDTLEGEQQLLITWSLMSLLCVTHQFAGYCVHPPDV